MTSVPMFGVTPLLAVADTGSDSMIGPAQGEGGTLEVPGGLPPHPGTIPMFGEGQARCPRCGWWRDGPEAPEGCRDPDCPGEMAAVLTVLPTKGE